MRALEFIAENGAGKISKRNQNATIGLHKFRDKNLADRVYELNRIMMATAATDGTFVPEIDNESWAGRYDVAAPYTKEEHNMLLMAYKAAGSNFKDLNKGDLQSQEHPGVNVTSPVTAFRGYPR
jgi:hypothetical protein